MVVWSTQPLPGIFPGGENGRCVRLTILPSSFVDSLEIWEPQTSGTVGAFPGLYWDCLVLIIIPKVTTIGPDSFSLP
jgi:hypothetical protein